MNLYPDHDMARLQELEEDVAELHRWLRDNPDAAYEAVREQRRRADEKQALINMIIQNKTIGEDDS